MNKMLLTLITMSSFIFSISQVQAKDVIVEIYKKQFIPSEVTIEAGDTVIWKNIEKKQS